MSLKMTGERNILDYLYVLIKWRRMVVSCVLVVSPFRRLVCEFM